MSWSQRDALDFVAGRYGECVQRTGGVVRNEPGVCPVPLVSGGASPAARIVASRSDYAASEPVGMQGLRGRASREHRGRECGHLDNSKVKILWRFEIFNSKHLGFRYRI